MRPFAESGFDELDMAYFEEHGLITDRHMINQEELEKLLDASVNMSKEELDAALDKYIPLPPMDEITSKIVFEEFRMKGDLRSMVGFYPRAMKCVREGDWKEFCEFVAGVYQLFPVVFADGGIFDDEMPYEYKRDFIVQCYVNHGDELDPLVERLSNFDPIGASVLPPEYADLDVITVYRAGEEEIEEASERCSWTLSKDVADFFMYKYRNRHANYLYKAKLATKDVIAYTNEREEFEVIQFCSVYDIEVLDRLPKKNK